MRDPLDGGFFRHAADAAWHIPYQQKTLADQARIALAFLEGAQGADAPNFASCAKGALDFALNRLALPDGTFASAQDATGDEYAGYYTWTAAEIDQVLGADSPDYGHAHGVMPDGNVPAGDDPSAQYAAQEFPALDHGRRARSRPGTQPSWPVPGTIARRPRWTRGARLERTASC